MRVTWWGGWPWRWRFYYVKQSRWGPFGELVLGFVGFTWPTTDSNQDKERDV